MAKKKEQTYEKDIVENQQMENIVLDNYMPYSMSVIESRAIPSLEDGLKPAHRKVLYTMYKMGLSPSSARSKSANIAGKTMEINPHGDASNYETMVRLTKQNETLLAPLVDGKGSFGKHYSSSMQAAASRYCVTGDTLIPTTEGLKRIDSIVSSELDSEQDINITIKSIDKLNTASKFFNSGLHNVRKITLKNGQELTATLNHPVLVKSKGSYAWKLFADLKKNDKILIDLGNNPIFGTYNDMNNAILVGKALSVAAKNISTKEELISNLDRLNIPFEVTKNLSLENTLFLGTESYQKLCLRTFIKNSKYYFKRDFGTPSKKIVGVEIRCILKHSKKLQVLLASNFGVYTILTKKGIFIPNVSLEKFVESFGLNFGIFKNIEPSKDLKYKNKFCAISSVEDLPKPQVVYSIRVDSDCHSFSSNAMFSHNTEARLSKITDEFFTNLKKHPELMMPNYDSTKTEPKLLPVTFPNVLANPNQGIAVGIASNICSFNLKELCEATISKIKHPRKDILDIMPGPDFSTGGYILYEEEVMKDIYKTGLGSIKLRAKYSVDEKKRIIEVTEIPFTTTSDNIIKGIVKLYKAGRLKEVSDVRDETGKDGFKIAIDYRAGYDPHQIMKKLFSSTKLQDSFSCNFYVLIDDSPKQMGVNDIILTWIDKRRALVKQELEFDLQDLKKRLHLLEGLEKILLDIDKCIKIIRKSKNDEEAISSLMKAFKIDEIQANYVADIRLRNLNKEYILNKTKDIKDLKQEIKDTQTKIKSGIDKEIISQLKEVIKNYSQERLTEIIPYENDEIEIKKEVEDFNSVLILTNDGYIKKIPESSFKEQNLKFKPGDYEIKRFIGNEESEILIYTNKGRVYKVRSNKIKSQTNQESGELLFSLAKCEASESVIHINFLEKEKSILICYQNGKVQHTPLSSYETLTAKKCFQKGFNISDKVISILDVNSKEDVFTLVGNDGRFVSAPAGLVPIKVTKTSQGVQVLKSPGITVSEAFIDKNPNFIVKKLPSAGKKVN